MRLNDSDHRAEQIRRGQAVNRLEQPRYFGSLVEPLSVRVAMYSALGIIELREVIADKNLIRYVTNVNNKVLDACGKIVRCAEFIERTAFVCLYFFRVDFQRDGNEFRDSDIGKIRKSFNVKALARKIFDIGFQRAQIVLGVLRDKRSDSVLPGRQRFAALCREHSDNVGEREIHCVAENVRDSAVLVSPLRAFCGGSFDSVNEFGNRADSYIAEVIGD